MPSFQTNCPDECPSIQLQLDNLTRELRELKANNVARAEQLQLVLGKLDAMHGMTELSRDHQHLLKWVKRANQQFDALQPKTEALRSIRCIFVKQLEGDREDLVQGICCCACQKVRRAE